MSRAPRQVLIIKTGFSEFLDRSISTTVSLGDVLLSTCILPLFKNDQVTWVTSWAARLLLNNNPYINRTLIFGPNVLPEITSRRYDVLVNLEKDIGICTWLTQIKASKRYGFYFNNRIHDIASYGKLTQHLLAGQENHRHIEKTWMESLYEALGARWNGERPILHRQRRSREKYDIGFNFSVGAKWPTKAWPIAKWKDLEKLLERKFTVGWQEGHKSILKYVDWMDSCRLVITSDSLGQILALALDKKVVSLYGPTDHRRMQKIENVTTLCSSLRCPHLPCYLPVCKFEKFCMDYIDPFSVAQTCERMLSEANARP